MQLKREHIYVVAVAVVVLLILIIVILSMSSSNSKPTPVIFERCDNTNTSVRTFLVDACPHGADQKSPCKLRRGQTIGFVLDFASAKRFDKAYTHMKVENHGYMTDACQLGLKCPVEARQWQSLAQLITLDESLQPRELDTMQYYLTSATSHDHLLCLEFPVEIV